MCRMVVCKATGNPKFNPSRLVKKALIFWNKSEGQSDGSGMGLVEARGLTIEKTALEAEKAPFSIKSHPTARLVLGHVRIASHGAIKDENSHPFLSEDGQLMLTHNGTLFGLKKAKKKLKKKGHKFESTTDSEILLHALEEWGAQDIMDKLADLGVYGDANWICVTKDGLIWASSDGALCISVNKKRIIIATNAHPFRSEFRTIQAGHLLTIKPNGFYWEEDIGRLPGWGWKSSYARDRTYTQQTGTDSYYNQSHAQRLEQWPYDMTLEEWIDFKQWLDKERESDT